MIRWCRMLALALLAASWTGPAALADEVRVAVAANFLEPMRALVERFEASSGHSVLVSSGSTGSHYALISNGAPFDAFFAADARRPRLLEEEGAAVAGSRFTYAVGRLALWSRRDGLVDDEGAVLATGGFRHLAMANPALAPYGAAARQVLERKGVWEALQDRLVLGQDVGQAYGFVHAGGAELGFVAYSQLRRSRHPAEGSHWLVPASLHDPIEQQAVLLNEDATAAREFLEFVGSEAARAVIRDHGYGS